MRASPTIFTALLLTPLPRGGHLALDISVRVVDTVETLQAVRHARGLRLSRVNPGCSHVPAISGVFSRSHCRRNARR